MRRIGACLLIVFVIIIFIPTVIVKTFDFEGKQNAVEGKSLKNKEPIIVEKVKPKTKDEESLEESIIENINIYNRKINLVEELVLEEYVKGVVAAEMPGEFHIEALKAQAIAARTYALSRALRYEEGHPDHQDAPLCTGIHCQAYLSYEDLEDMKGSSWIENYWEKIEEAVKSTEGLIIYYKGEITESLYHSTSGGMTEDAVNVFATDSPYLKSVISPYEEEAPKYRTIVNLTGEEFISKIMKEYPQVEISKEDFWEKIKLIEKTTSGRIKTLAINDTIIEGRNIRELFELNSTNFTITYDKKLNLIEIITYGYGHGVGMSQWGANGMAKKGSDYEEILKHYYTDIEIK